MGEVVSFPSTNEGPHVEGPVRCMACRHEWRAVAPPGFVDDFECPSCGIKKGVRMSTVGPADDIIWRCNCGNDYFLLLPQGAPMCANCGLRATSWVES